MSVVATGEVASGWGPGTTPGGHGVQFHGDDGEFVAAMTGDAGAALGAGVGVVVIATPAHRLALLQALAGGGEDTEAAQSSARLVMADAARTLERCTIGGHPDPASVQAVVDGFVSRAGAGGTRPVRVMAEMGTLLWEAGRLEAAIELEQLGNELVTEGSFSALCAYPALAVAGAERAHALARLCRLHTAVRGGTPAGRCAPTPAATGESARVFPATADAPGQARRFVAGLLPASEGELCDTAQLVVTELATNAVTHARSAFSVAVSVLPHVLRIAVRDASAEDPESRLPSAEDTSGRGLLVVDAVAFRWGVRPLTDGKAVWAEIPR